MNVEFKEIDVIIKSKYLFFKIPLLLPNNYNIIYNVYVKIFKLVVCWCKNNKASYILEKPESVLTELVDYEYNKLVTSQHRIILVRT